MHTSLHLFIFEGQEVRVVAINGQPYWVIADVCKVLELDQPHRVADRLDPKGVTKSTVLSAGGPQEMLCINEPNLYRTIFRSNKPEAKAFQDWVFEEVLPSIRKTGSYSIVDQQPQNPLEILVDPKRLRSTIEDLEDKALALKKTLQFFKIGEEMLFPSQVHTRGKRKTPPVKLFRTKSGEVVEQMLLLFE